MKRELKRLFIVNNKENFSEVFELSQFGHERGQIGYLAKEN